MNPDLSLFLQVWTGGGEVSETENQRLLNRLRDDPEFRAECVAEMRMLGMCQASQSAAPRWIDLNEALGVSDVSQTSRADDFALGVMSHLTERGDKRQSQSWWLWKWRPLQAAAAGLVIGLCSASLVWAVAKSGTTVETRKILIEGFEDGQVTPGRGFPRRANFWAGDLSVPVTAEAEIVPAEGSRMVRLNPAPGRKLGYAWRILDLSEHPVSTGLQSRQLEVTASFQTSGEARPLRYQIRLAAFSQEPPEVREVWNNESLLFDTVLQHVGRNVGTKPGDHGWQTVRAAMEIPPGTRSVVISLAAGEADTSLPPAEHYLDDVQARFVITSAREE